MEAKELIHTYRRFGVIGVTEDKEKYGYKIYQCLKQHGYTVYGISPLYPSVDGDKMYSSIQALPEPVDVMVFVVSVKYGYDYAKACAESKIPYIWLQPGTYDDDFITYLNTLPIEFVQDCVLRQLNK